MRHLKPRPGAWYNHGVGFLPFSFLLSPCLMYETPEDWYDACIACKKSGNIDEAIGMLKELVEKYPQYALAYAALGAYYAQKNQVEEAIEYSKKYCEWAPDDPFGFSILSSLCIKLGRREEAEEALFQARDLRIAAQRQG